MLLGYNQKRPTTEDYAVFEHIFVAGLRSLSIDGLSLLVYGSYVRGEAVYGRSDIDAVLIFPDDVVIQKENLAACGNMLAATLETSFVPFQVTPTDVGTLADGRFSTFTDDFEDYFSKDLEVKIAVGKDYRSLMMYDAEKSGMLQAAAFNLRKSRVGLLFASYFLKHDYEQFLRSFNKSLDSTARAGKCLLYLLDGDLRTNKFAMLPTLCSVFPSVDFQPLEQIQELYGEPSKLDALYHKPDEVLTLWNSSLTLYETMIKEYICMRPREL